MRTVMVAVAFDDVEMEWLEQRAERAGVSVEVSVGKLLKQHVGNRVRAHIKEYDLLDDIRAEHG